MYDKDGGYITAHQVALKYPATMWVHFYSIKNDVPATAVADIPASFGSNFLTPGPFRI